MSLKTLQGLLVVTAIAWGIFPKWGGFVFGAIYLLMVLTALAKSRSARKVLKTHREKMEGSLTAEAIAWAEKYPFFYVWPDAARQWGTTLKMTSFMMILLSVWFGIRGFFFLSPTVWFAVIPCAVLFFFGVTFSGRFDIDAIIGEDRYQPKKVLHDEVKKVLALQAVAGKWSPGEPA